VAAVFGSNHAEVGAVVGPPFRGRRTVTAICALDNLVKGGAGQAIQNMNLMLGLPETMSLEDPGPWPP
jgi:N-acetyl-gamma-glutamyl-phosphate reductase